MAEEFKHPDYFRAYPYGKAKGRVQAGLGRVRGPGEIRVYSYILYPGRGIIHPDPPGQTHPRGKGPLAADFFKFAVLYLLKMPNIHTAQDIILPVNQPDPAHIPA